MKLPKCTLNRKSYEYIEIALSHVNIEINLKTSIELVAVTHPLIISIVRLCNIGQQLVHSITYIKSLTDNVNELNVYNCV